MTDLRRPLEPSRLPRAAGSGAAHLPPADPGRLLPSDLAAAGAVAVVVVLGTWLRHGALREFSEGWNGSWTALAQLTGLVASLIGLAGLVLVARPRALERYLGLDRMFDWHRLLGGAMALVLAAHVVSGLLEWRPTAGSWWGAVLDLTGRESYYGLAAIGSGLVAVVTITSLRAVRRRLAYETWYLVHLVAYAGLTMSFGHTIVWGADFSDDTLARSIWIGLHLVVLAALLLGRWRHLTIALFGRRLVVSGRSRLNDDTVVLTLAGPALAAMEGEAGQFVFLRPLRRRLWWQAHPFSLSAAPTTAGLELTVKERGDASHAIANLPLGTSVVVEGPYGATTADALDDRPAVFIVGGVGIAPVRALLQRLGPQHRPVVLFRAHRPADLVHFADVQRLAEACNGRALALVGPTARLAVKDPFAARHLLAAVPDLTDRVAVLCGPERLVSAARSGLRAAGVARADIRYERAWW